MRNTLGMRSLLFASFPDNNLYLYPVVVPLGCQAHKIYVFINEVCQKGG